MFGGGTVLAFASAGAPPPAQNARAASSRRSRAGVLWGTMYIPYRKAYLTGMSPLSFITFFTIGEVVTMAALALSFSGGVAPACGGARRRARACSSGFCSADSSG